MCILCKTICVRPPLPLYAGCLNFCEHICSVEGVEIMSLCSVASDLSNYDSCQSVHFCVLIQLSFCLVV